MIDAHLARGTGTPVFPAAIRRISIRDSTAAPPDGMV
jgi:hypothetical protein